MPLLPKSLRAAHHLIRAGAGFASSPGATPALLLFQCRRLRGFFGQSIVDERLEQSETGVVAAKPCLQRRFDARQTYFRVLSNVDQMVAIVVSRDNDPMSDEARRVEDP